MGEPEYCCLRFEIWRIGGDARKERGWRRDGAAEYVREERESGSRWHELTATEGWTSDDAHAFLQSTEDGRQAFLDLLNRFAKEGWRVVDYHGVDLMGSGQDWPRGDFLLLRETETFPIGGP